MFYVIHARKAVLLVLVLVLIGITFWAGFYGTEKAVDVDTGPKMSAEPGAGDTAVLAPRTISELEEGTVVTVTSVPTKFVEYRIERERIRSQKLDLLQSMLADGDLDSGRRQQLQGELIQAVNDIAKETELENLLRVNGFLDAVVLIENDTATVVVPVTLSRMEAEMIGELVHRLTNIRFDRITIIDEMAQT